MIALHESRLARWRGILRLSRRQLQQRWLESLLILLGLAMGVGVFTGTETYIRYGVSMASRMMRTQRYGEAIRVMPRRIDMTMFYEQDVPAIRLTEAMEDPVQFELDDLLAVREAVPDIGYALLGSSTFSQRITALDGGNIPLPASADSMGVQIQIRAATPDEFPYVGHEFLAGAPFTWDDFVQRARRVVLESDAAKDLFPDLTPEEVVGRTFTTSRGIQGDMWQIVGVIETPTEDPNFPSGLGLFGETEPLVSYGPPTETFPLNIREFFVMPREGVRAENVVREIQAYFDQVYSPGRVDVREPMASQQSGFYIPLLVLSGLALLIAAVNILNLFTARILRRQRYTGMSQALGATRSMLFWQTSGESLLLGLIGSIVGLVFSVGVIRLLLMLLRAQMDTIMTGFDPYADLALTPLDAAIGLALGTGISLIFGLYPALLASRQDPAEALRTE